MAGPHFRYEVATAESTPACHDARKLRASLAAVLALVYVPACDGPSVASAGPPYHVQNDVTDLQPGVCTRPAAGWHAIRPHLKHYNWPQALQLIVGSSSPGQNRRVRGRHAGRWRHEFTYVTGGVMLRILSAKFARQ